MVTNKARGITAGRTLWLTSHRDSIKIYTMNVCLSSENHQVDGQEAASLKELVVSCKL